MSKMNDIQWQALREKVYKRDLGVCQYCGIELKDSYHVDHVIPQIKGGNNSLKNLALSCQRCNNKKHDMWIMEFAIYLEKRGFDLQHLFSIRMLRECGIEPMQWKIDKFNELKIRARKNKPKKVSKKELSEAMKFPGFSNWHSKFMNLLETAKEVEKIARRIR